MTDGGQVLKTIGAVAIIAAALWLSFQAGRLCRIPSPQTDTKPKTDTLYLHDTTVQIRPIYVTRTVIDTLRVPVPVRDTIMGTDTVFVLLPREQVRWRDSLCTVYASGIQPHVDSVAHYVTERVITVPVTAKTKSRWGLGIQAGAGAGKDGLTPYVGFGISYNLLAW